MGTPEEAAATFMTVFAPPGSDKTAQLLGAASRYVCHSAAQPFMRRSQHVAFPPTISIAAAARLC